MSRWFIRLIIAYSSTEMLNLALYPSCLFIYIWPCMILGHVLSWKAIRGDSVTGEKRKYRKGGGPRGFGPFLAFSSAFGWNSYLDNSHLGVTERNIKTLIALAQSTAHQPISLRQPVYLLKYQHLKSYNIVERKGVGKGWIITLNLTGWNPLISVV